MGTEKTGIGRPIAYTEFVIGDQGSEGIGGDDGWIGADRGPAPAIEGNKD